MSTKALYILYIDVSYTNILHTNTTHVLMMAFLAQVHRADQGEGEASRASLEKGEEGEASRASLVEGAEGEASQASLVEGAEGEASQASLVEGEEGEASQDPLVEGEGEEQQLEIEDQYSVEGQCQVYLHLLEKLVLKVLQIPAEDKVYMVPIYTLHCSSTYRII